jgi:hypothetical protein
VAVGRLAATRAPVKIGPSRVALLAQFFRAHPNTWIDGRELALVAGAYAWRSRVSDLRKPPFNLLIENRQRKLTAKAGAPFTVSEYRWTSPVRRQEAISVAVSASRATT